MCTSIISNRNKTVVGWNLDLIDMEHRVVPSDAGVFIEVFDKTEGWLPLFGANANGDFVGMPTCWPFDARSDPKGREKNIIELDIDLLTMKKSLSDIRRIAEEEPVCSVKGVTFMASLSDGYGNLLHIVPGQGYRYYEKPEYAVMTNFSPFKMNSEVHPWMGWDRYNRALELLKSAPCGFDVDDCFGVLKEVSQTVCPTVVSMVYDVTERTVYWCESRNWSDVRVKRFSKEIDGSGQK